MKQQLVDLLIAMDGTDGEAVRKARRAAFMSVFKPGELNVKAAVGRNALDYRGAFVVLLAKDTDASIILSAVIHDSTAPTGYDLGEIYSRILEIEKLHAMIAGHETEECLEAVRDLDIAGLKRVALGAVERLSSFVR